MLFFLQSINSDKTLYLINHNEFIVGRKNCNLLIENDSSISRTHAKIYVESEKVTLEDLKSKYKTFINDQELTPNVKVQLNDKDSVQFGGLHSKFIFQQLKCVTTATQLSVTQKDALKKQLTLLRGEYTNNWSSECTHLTLEKISLTVKVLHALLDDKPIVVPSFWTKYADNVTKNIAPPNIEKYNDPPLAEALLNKVEFKNVAERKDLFKGKTFLFVLEKEKKQVGELIEKAGGSCISWEKEPVKLRQVTQSPQEFLIMQSVKDVDDKAYRTIKQHFSDQNKRTIPIQEIAMAIIRGSCEKDCNPSFNRIKEVLGASVQKEHTQHNPLATNTESEVFIAECSQLEKVIPETIESSRMDVPEIKDNEQTEEVMKVTECKSIAKDKEITKDTNYNEDITPIREKERVQKVTDVTKPTNTTKDMEPAKRAGEDTDDQNPCKRPKLDGTQQTRSLQSEDKSNVESDIQSSEKYIWTSRESYKRKVVDNADSEDISSDEEVLINPFMPVSKKKKITASIASKPFATLRMQTENNTTNLLSNIDESKIDEPLLSSTTREDTAYEIDSVYCSKISTKYNYIWHSKKSVISLEENIEDEEMNTDLEKIVDSLKNKVLIDVLVNLTIRSTKSSDEIDCTNSSNGNNCKRFKKVKPLCPQTTMVTINDFKVPNTGCSIAV